MNAAQMFGTCRERYKRKENPEAVNENLAFVNDTAYTEYISGTGWVWKSLDGTHVMKVVERDEWGYSAVPGDMPWGRFRRNNFGTDRPASLFCDHTHVNESGELYMRLGFMSSNGDKSYTDTIFSIMDKAAGTVDIEVGCAIARPANSQWHSMAPFVKYTDALGGTQTIQMDPIQAYSAAGRGWQNTYELRIYIPAKEKNEPARIVLNQLRNQNFTVEKIGEGTAGKGYMDKAGEKQLAWMSKVIGGAQGEATCAPGRLGIGNLIKYALPTRST